MKSNCVIYGLRWYYLLQVTVCTGKGTVWENLTQGLPVLNPRDTMEGGLWERLTEPVRQPSSQLVTHSPCSTTKPYTEISAICECLTSFATQVVKQQLVQEATSVVKSSNGLHVVVSHKTVQQGHQMARTFLLSHRT